MIRARNILLLALFSTLAAAPAADAQQHLHTVRGASWPALEQFLRVATLQDYNTRIVVLGTAFLGLGCGTIGSFLLLRKRALLGDALSHATLPGIALAFFVMVLAGGSGKWLPGLLIGAAITGVLGVITVLFIRNATRLKEDAGMGIVLSVFFGIGVAILGIVTRMGRGSAAGLENFIVGKTASMLLSDAQLILGVAIVVAILCALLYKEFTLICFDQDFARSQGWPVVALDLVMMALVTAVTVIGLQAVGVILIVAMLVIPPAAARFWTENLRTMLLLAALIGAISGLLGAALSALMPGLPAGAVIVLVATGAFGLSMLLGTSRGVLVRSMESHRLNRRVHRQNLLRAVYEWLESHAATPDQLESIAVPLSELLRRRSWSPGRLSAEIRRARRDKLLLSPDAQHVRLTPRGVEEAQRVVRNHRLWEMYLIAHADIAPSHVDRGADMIEHVLGEEMVSELEQLLADQRPQPVPFSPHLIRSPDARGGAA